jgi:hypothetical protein
MDKAQNHSQLCPSSTKKHGNVVVTCTRWWCWSRFTYIEMLEGHSGGSWGLTSQLDPKKQMISAPSQKGEYELTDAWLSVCGSCFVQVVFHFWGGYSNTINDHLMRCFHEPGPETLCFIWPNSLFLLMSWSWSEVFAPCQPQRAVWSSCWGCTGSCQISDHLLLMSQIQVKSFTLCTPHPSPVLREEDLFAQNPWCELDVGWSFSRIHQTWQKQQMIL